MSEAKTWKHNLRAQGICVEPWGEDVPCNSCRKNGTCGPNDPCPPECETNGEEPVPHPDCVESHCGSADPCTCCPDNRTAQDRVDISELAGSDRAEPAPDSMGAFASELEDSVRHWQEYEPSPKPGCGHSPEYVTTSGHCIECSWERNGKANNAAKADRDMVRLAMNKQGRSETYAVSARWSEMIDEALARIDDDNGLVPLPF